MWPTPQDYNEAVQNPRLSFDDAELKAGVPETNDLGLPKPRTGSFASVYHIQGAGGDFAVRCFLHNFGDHEKRYAEIGKFLQGTKIAHMVDFRFLSRGVLSHGTWFPILKMQWVNGVQLNDWINAHIDDTDGLAVLRDRFVELCRGLVVAGIAHGDLQHGNILVVDGKLKLVDYDGIFIPQLKALGSNELGHRNYQHPARSTQDFALHLDRFSAWSIYTSLFCLARDPSLWQKLSAGDECLLFRYRDYKNPKGSTAFRVLEHHELPEIRRAAKELRKLLDHKLEELPDLGQPVSNTDTLAALEPPSSLPEWLSAPDSVPPLAMPGEQSTAAAASASAGSANDVLAKMSRAVSGKGSFPTKPFPGLSQAAPFPLKPAPPGSIPITPSVSLPGQKPPPAPTAGSLPSVPNSTVTPARKPKRIISAAMMQWALLVTAVLLSSAIISAVYSFIVWQGKQATAAAYSAALERGQTSFRDAQGCMFRGLYSAAIAKYHKALADFEVVHSEQGMAMSCYGLGLCYRATKDYGQAIGWMEKAIDRFHADDYAPMILFDLGNLYKDTNESTKANYYLDRAALWNHQIRGDTRALNNTSSPPPEPLLNLRAPRELDSSPAQ